MIEFEALTCHLSIKEECLTGHNQDDIGLSTHSSTGNTQRMKGGDNISRTRI